jgi:hypothetical protein
MMASVTDTLMRDALSASPLTWLATNADCGATETRTRAIPARCYLLPDRIFGRHGVWDRPGGVVRTPRARTRSAARAKNSQDPHRGAVCLHAACWRAWYTEQ